jgi:DNA polymerase phi
MALDLIEVLVTKQPEQLLILQLLELLLNIIQRLYQAEAGPPAQDRLHLHAPSLSCTLLLPGYGALCREALHAQVERFAQQAGNQVDASVTLYYFNASLYLLLVLKGNTSKRHRDGQKLQEADTMSEPKDSDNQTASCFRLELCDSGVFGIIGISSDQAYQPTHGRCTPQHLLPIPGNL